jgi:hypothetical protein
LRSKSKILKHIAVDDLTKTLAVIYYFQADIIWPDGTCKKLVPAAFNWLDCHLQRMGKIAPDEWKVISIICHKLSMSSAHLIAAKFILAEGHHESWPHDDKKVSIRYNPNNAHYQ